MRSVGPYAKDLNKAGCSGRPREQTRRRLSWVLAGTELVKRASRSQAEVSGLFLSFAPLT